MKKLTTLILSLVSTAMLAQIPNASFENWTSGTPDNWNLPIPVPGVVSQSSNAHAGSSAISLNSVYFVSTYVGGIAWSGSGDGYYLDATNPAAVTGWYILNSSGGDELSVTAATKCASGSGNSGGAFTTSTSTAVYKQFTVCLVGGSCTPDSSGITLGLIGTSGSTHSGSYAIVDELSYTTCPSGVPTIGNSVTLEKAYPNPANTNCNIIYSIPSSGTVSINLYDISGRKVKGLLADTKQTPGRYKVPVDVTSLPNGIYIYTVTVNGQVYSQRLSIAR